MVPRSATVIRWWPNGSETDSFFSGSSEDLYPIMVYKTGSTSPSNPPLLACYTILTSIEDLILKLYNDQLTVGGCCAWEFSQWVGIWTSMAQWHVTESAVATSTMVVIHTAWAALPAQWVHRSPRRAPFFSLCSPPMWRGECRREMDGGCQERMVLWGRMIEKGQSWHWTAWCWGRTEWTDGPLTDCSN